MNKKITIALLILVACLTAGQSFSQLQKIKTKPGQYRAVNWGLDEGLSSTWVTAMIKDVNGFLWIGTGFGLNRFDGSRFKKYFADKTKKNKTVPGNGINGLIEDSLHNIWIGTVKGLSCYDTKSDSLRNIYSDLPRNEMVPFWATKDEVFFWDYPENQLAAYNIYSFAKRTLVKIKTTDTVGFNITAQYAIFDAVSNSIWMARGFQGKKGGLCQVSLADGERHFYDWPCHWKIPNHSHFFESMRYDLKRHSIWIDSYEGLIEFTLTNKEFHHIDALNEFLSIKGFNRWAGIDIDRDGRVWVATHPKGILIYDPANNSVNMPFPNDSDLQKEVSDENLFLYCDKEGMAWSGTMFSKCIYQIIPFSPALKHYAADADKSHNSATSVFNFQHAGQGTFWMGSDDGIILFNPRTGYLDHIPVTAMKGVKGGNHFIVLSIDTVGKKAWIFHSNAIYLMDMASRKCRSLLYEDSNGKRLPFLSVLANHPQSMYSLGYKNGLIIGATLPGHQEILMANFDEPVARKILSFQDEKIDLPTICTNDDNLIFFKRSDVPLTYTYRNSNWMQIPSSLDSIQWSGIYFNKTDQTYWIIADVELIHYDKNLRCIHKYTNEDGMPGTVIDGVISDNKGNIWFNTARSIFQLNGKSGTITQLAEKDGFFTHDVGTFSRGIKDDNGDIYISDNPGFDRLSPDKYAFSASSIYFESLKINQKAFNLSTGINHAAELYLKYSENNINLETGIIDYYSKGKGHIRYKLEANGKDVGWQYAPAYYTIRYEGLPPGKYRLIAQSSNAANEFNGPQKILVINIDPAFWNTWWFRTIAVAFAFGIFYLIIRYRTQQKFRRQLERTGKEKQIAELGQRTAELQQQKIEMEMQALRAQMNPHFIFNSLNSINRFILQNNRAQASEYLTKFSKLVRMILQNSQASLISLEAELESLGLYLEMEALRFNYHFDYNITTSIDLDVEVLQVPPLILQPYVENAIWHGLMHKEEKGQLNIDVRDEDDHLYFRITDNGIGRRKAAELASKSATKHKSMGLRITKDRIAMLEKNSGGESPVKIVDLENEDGSAAGTEVIIKMPVIYE